MFKKALDINFKRRRHYEGIMSRAGKLHQSQQIIFSTSAQFKACIRLNAHTATTYIEINLCEFLMQIPDGS